MSTDMSLQALHGILFEEIDRLNDTSLSDDELESEIKRAEAMEGVANTIVKNAGVILKTAQACRYGSLTREAKQLIGRGDGDE